MKKSNGKNLKSKFVNKYLGVVGTIGNIRDIILGDDITKKLVGKKGQWMSGGVFIDDDMIHFVKTSEIDSENTERIIIGYIVLEPSYGDEGIPCDECMECEMFLQSRVVIADIEFMNMN